MKILHCITGLSGDGAQRMLLRLALSLREQGFHQEVVNLGPTTDFASFFCDGGIPVRSLKMKAGLASACTGVVRLSRILGEVQPDVVQGWMYHSNLMLVGARFLSRLRSPLLWNIRRGLDDYQELSLKTRMLIRMSAHTSVSADRILYCSSESRAQHEAFGFAPAAGVVMENGFDVSRFKPSRELREEVRRQYSIATDALVVGCVGRFDIAKGHAYLFDAFADLTRRRPGVTLLCAGRGMSSTHERLREMLRQRSIEGSVVLLGEQAAPERIYPAMDLYCSSSIGEGFPNVVSEAMACGVPCVVTDTGASRAVVGDSGVVVPTRNATALMEGMASMIERGALLRQELGARARARIEKLFSLDAIAARYASLYVESVAPR